jgi:hypothetical protein
VLLRKVADAPHVPRRQTGVIPAIHLQVGPLNESGSQPKIGSLKRPWGLSTEAVSAPPQPPLGAQYRSSVGTSSTAPRQLSGPESGPGSHDPGPAVQSSLPNLQLAGRRFELLSQSTRELQPLQAASGRQAYRPAWFTVSGSEMRTEHGHGYQGDVTRMSSQAPSNTLKDHAPTVPVGQVSSSTSNTKLSSM